jgi:predicted RNA-binding protein YlxR (DUF448 family)
MCDITKERQGGSGVTPKKIPVRRCVGCGQGKPNRALVRLVRSADGEISLDLTGRKAGRGAYLCGSVACLEKARKRKSLERALSGPVPEETLDQLAEQIARLEEDAADG